MAGKKRPAAPEETKTPSGKGKKSTAAKPVEKPAKKPASRPAKKTGAPSPKPDMGSKKSNETPLLEEPKKALQEPPAAPLPTEAPPPPIVLPEESEKRIFWGRAVLLLCLVAILAASVFLFLIRPTSYDMRGNSVAYLYQPASGLTQIVVNGKVCWEAPGVLAETESDRTGRISVARIGEALYLSRGRRVEKIADFAFDFVLSADGSAIAWRDAEAHLYYRATKRSSEPSRVSSYQSSADYCISPDGDTLFYVYLEDGVPKIDLRMQSGSKPYFKENTGLVPVAVADDCRYLYYLNSEGTLSLMDGKSETVIRCGGAVQPESLVFNRDLSEVFFRDDVLGSVLYRRGTRLILPDLSTQEQLIGLPNQNTVVRRQGPGHACMVRTICDDFCYLRLKTADGAPALVCLVRKRDAGELQHIDYVDSRDAVAVTDKGIYYLSTHVEKDSAHTALYRVRNGKTETERLSNDVRAFCPNVDGSRLLYVDQQGALYAYRVGRLPERLTTSEVVRPDSLAATADDIFYCYTETGTLYVSENGGKLRALEGDFGFFAIDAHTVFLFGPPDENGTAQVFTNDRGRRRNTLIASGVTPQSPHGPLISR